MKISNEHWEIVKHFIHSRKDGIEKGIENLGVLRPLLNQDLEEGVEDQDKFIQNLVYCKQRHSFVHRLYTKWNENFPDNKRVAQQQALNIIEEMYEETENE